MSCPARCPTASDHASRSLGGSDRNGASSRATRSDDGAGRSGVTAVTLAAVSAAAMSCRARLATIPHLPRQ